METIDATREVMRMSADIMDAIDDIVTGQDTNLVVAALAQVIVAIGTVNLSTEEDDLN